MSGDLRLLLVDDNPDDRALVERELQREFPASRVDHARDGADLERALSEGPYDAAIIDFHLHWSDGLAVLHNLRGRQPELPVIMFTGTGSEEIAVQAMKQGLDDYVIKTPHHLKRLTAALRQSLERQRERAKRANLEARFGELFEAVPVGLVRCTRDDQILAGNPALAQLLGCPDQEALLRTPASRFWAVPEEHRRFLADMERDGVVRGREVVVRRFDGSRAWALLDARCSRDERGRLLYYEGSVIDVTGRRELEAQLRQAQKMEAIGRLAGGVAHDFNNLLTVINGYSRLLLDRLPEDDPARADLEQVHQAGRRAMELTQRLLAFSRRQVLEPRVLDPSALVSGLERMLRRLIPESIVLEPRLEPQAGHVLADPGQIEQALMNLVTNARDAMPRGGTLAIETRNERIDEAAAQRHPGMRPGLYVVLSVSDTVHGFDLKTRSRLFEPFFTTKTRGQGTGLGLASVYGIVKQSGG